MTSYMSSLDCCCVDNPRGKYSEPQRPHEHEDHKARVTQRLKTGRAYEVGYCQIQRLTLSPAYFAIFASSIQ